MRVWKCHKTYTNGVRLCTIKVGNLPPNNIKRHKTVLHWYFNAERSARNVRRVVKDLSLCNKFDYFVTFTFSSDREIVSDRLDDEVTIKLYLKWRKEIRRKFPDMRYITVPEYHKKGGLHFHIVVGGVTAKDLMLSYWHDVECRGDMIPCYIVNSWKNGFSTATKIQGDSEAVIHYIMKYITKGAPDPRFFRKHRFYCSQNCLRPVLEKEESSYIFIDGDEVSDSLLLRLKYFDYAHRYFEYEEF